MLKTKGQEWSERQYLSDVRVIERSVNLVEHKERRRISSMHGEQKRKSCHSFLASRQIIHRSEPLPGRNTVVLHNKVNNYRTANEIQRTGSKPSLSTHLYSFQIRLFHVVSAKKRLSTGISWEGLQSFSSQMSFFNAILRISPYRFRQFFGSLARNTLGICDSAPFSLFRSTLGSFELSFGPLRILPLSQLLAPSLLPSWILQCS